MSEVTIQISGKKPGKYTLKLSDLEISKLLATLKRDFKLKIEKETRREELAEELEGLKQALKEVQLIKEGKLRAIPIEELLNEIS